MSLDPALNPTLTGGRQYRFAKHAVTTRNFRTNAAAEKRLKTLGELLAGAAKEDRLSLSLILRRAVEVYENHVLAISTNPDWLERERVVVRRDSLKPTLRKKTE